MMTNDLLERLEENCLNKEDKKLIKELFINEKTRIDEILDGKVWVSRSKNTVKVSDMAPNYIENVINYLLRRYDLSDLSDTVLFKELLMQYSIKILNIKGGK